MAIKFQNVSYDIYDLNLLQAMIDYEEYTYRKFARLFEFGRSSRV